MRIIIGQTERSRSRFTEFLRKHAVAIGACFLFFALLCVVAGAALWLQTSQPKTPSWLPYLIIPAIVIFIIWVFKKLFGGADDSGNRRGIAPGTITALVVLSFALLLACALVFGVYEAARYSTSIRIHDNQGATVAPVPEQRQPVKVATPVSETASAPPPPRNIQKPLIVEIPIASSSHLYAEGLLDMSVTHVRNFNGLTAVTFKLDGSGNTRSDVQIICPASNDSVGIRTNIIDDTGNRHRFIGPSDALEHMNCDGSFYLLAPHEVVYRTWLFENWDPSIRTFDFNTVNTSGQAFQIHVVLQ